jgi:ribonuclease P protein component
VTLLISEWRWRAAPREPHPIAARAFEEAMREEDVSTQQSQAKQEARLSPADADEGRAQCSAAPSVQGPLTPVGLIWPVRERSTFRALAQGRRRRRGVVMVSSAAVGSGAEPPRVAYAVGRGVGGAVVRNRVRRRLRAATREHAAELVGGRAYLVGATAAAAQASYDQLRTSLHDALRALREETR